MALLENLQPGNIYLVKVSASNEMGDGPFSSAVELAVQTDGSSSGHVPRRSHGSTHATGQRRVHGTIQSFKYHDQSPLVGSSV